MAALNSRFPLLLQSKVLLFGKNGYFLGLGTLVLFNIEKTMELIQNLYRKNWPNHTKEGMLCIQIAGETCIINTSIFLTQ